MKSMSAPLSFVVLPFVTGLLVSCGGGGGGAAPDPASSVAYTSPQRLTLDVSMAPLAPNASGAITSYSISPPLPSGLALNPATGQISGTPSVTSAAASYRITASGTQGSATFDLNLAVDYPQPFWLEPARRTIVGVGQIISLSAAYKAQASDAYPTYLDNTAVSWLSSNPSCATVNANGRVTGVSPCSTTITAIYSGHTAQLPVQVSGNWVNRSVTVAGQGSRSYSVYEPDFGSTPGPHPAILALHGGGGSALIQASTSQLANLAHQQKTYVAFLEGSGAVKTFNAGACCGYAKTNHIDDVAYAQAVLDDLESAYTVRSEKVYAIGMSNGGMMAHRLACAMSERLAGIAAVSGASAQFDQALTQYYSCTPARRIPILHIHATNDRNYPFAGGTGSGPSGTAYYPVDATIADWRTRNNVSSAAAVTRVTATTTCYRYANAADAGQSSAPVTLCKIDPIDVYDSVNQIVLGGGHAWPGGTRSPSGSSDTPIMDFVANDYLWAYFNP